MGHLPNVITILRIGLALLFPFVEPDQRLNILIIALLSEFADGFVARAFGWYSVSGRVMDPIADRLFAFSVAFTFYAAAQLELSQILVILIRDITVTVGLALTVFYVHHLDFITDLKPSFMGKVTTVAQYFVFLNVILQWTSSSWLIGLTCLFSILAAVMYINHFIFGDIYEKKSVRFF